MPDNDERMKILNMIEEGKISAEEGARLIAALSESRRSPRRRPTQRNAQGGARMLRLRVTDTLSGKARATINLPLGLVDAGLNIAAQYAPEVDFDELLGAIDAGYQGKVIDVFNEEDGEHVEIFIE